MSKAFFSRWGIFIGLIVGALIGYVLNFIGDNSFTVWTVANVFQPIGTIFIRSLFMIVVPLVFSSLTMGVANLGDTNTLKQMGLRVVLFYITTTFCAIIVGQTLINTIQPGSGMNQEIVDNVMSKSQNQVAGLREKSKLVLDSLWPGIVNTVIPKNILNDFASTNMLAVIFVSIVFGIGILYLRDEKSKVILQGWLSSISDITIMIVGWIMKAAPIAVAALMASAVFNFGMDIMKALALYVVVVLAGYLIQFFFVYGALLKFIIRIPPKEFYKRASAIFLTAFSTSSSSATMPVTIETLQRKFGIPEKITNFTIPIGVTVNMDGTALFEVVAAVFIAQVFGVDLSLFEQGFLIILVLITSIGVAGVPSGSIPILMMAMSAVGIPDSGIALILGVDRLLDMGRTVVNVTGDTIAALFMAQKSGVDLKNQLKNIEA